MDVGWMIDMFMVSAVLLNELRDMDGLLHYALTMYLFKAFFDDFLHNQFLSDNLKHTIDFLKAEAELDHAIDTVRELHWLIDVEAQRVHGRINA